MGQVLRDYDSLILLISGEKTVQNNYAVHETCTKSPVCMTACMNDIIICLSIKSSIHANKIKGSTHSRSNLTFDSELFVYQEVS